MVIQRTSITDKVTNIIYERIVTKKYAPGELLPSQDKLAEEFGVSRNSIREAINRLSGRGIIESKQGIGTYILPRHGGLSNIKAFESLHLTPEDGVEIVEVRLALERTIVRLAAVKCTAELLSKIEENLLRQRDAVPLEDSEQFIQLDVEFHLLLADASNNNTFRHLVEAYLDYFHVLIKTAMADPLFIEAAYNYHSLIFKAIASRDPVKADRAMLEHIIGIVRLLPGNEDYSFLSKAFSI